MNIGDGALIDTIERGYLHVVPKEMWLEENRFGHSKWLYPALANEKNAKAIGRMVAHGASLLCRNWNISGSTILHEATGVVLEAICRNASSLSLRNQSGFSALQSKSVQDSKILIKHGARFEDRHDVNIELLIYQNSILRCRSATIAMLKLFDVGSFDYRWDRNLFIQLARLVWETRGEDWESQEDSLKRTKVMQIKQKLANYERKKQALREMLEEITF